MTQDIHLVGGPLDGTTVDAGPYEGHEQLCIPLGDEKYACYVPSVEGVFEFEGTIEAAEVWPAEPQ